MLRSSWVITGRVLDREDETKPIVNLGEQSKVDSADSLRKKRLVHGDDLRDIDYGRFRKPGSLERQANVSRRVGQTQVRGDDRCDYRADATLIEAIRRNDKQWPPESGAGSGGLRKRRPPNLAAAHYRLRRESVRC